MLPINLALTSHSDQVAMGDLTEVAAALQKQITRDFAPIWNVDATIAAFSADQIPQGYWPISIEDNLDAFPGAAGIHLNEQDNSPYALVLFGPTWSLTASHEMMEMLADPWGSRTVPGQSPRQAQGRVDFLVEVCDPCEDAQFAYTVNGVTVSDFYTPNYFDPVAAANVRYSFSGAITAPRQVLTSGYLSWFDARRHLFQAMADQTGAIEILDRGPMTNRERRPLREYVDGLTPNHHQKLSNARLPVRFVETRMAAREASNAAGGRLSEEAKRWRRAP
jgi:hypothetical protein